MRQIAANITNDKEKPGDLGAVIVEFAAVVILLIAFITSLYQVGRFFSQVSWIAQTAYQVALVGAMNVPGATANGRMEDRFDKLKAIQTEQAFDIIWPTNPTGSTRAEKNPITQYLAGTESIVQIQLVGTFNSPGGPFGKLSIPLSISVSAPVLVLKISNIGNTAVFCNDDVPFCGNTCN